MKVLLVVLSRHHGNTGRIARVFAEVFDAPMKTPRQTDMDELQELDLIGFGSGIDSDRHYAELLELAASLPQVVDRKAFIFSTCGMPVSVAGRNAVAAYAAKSHSALRQALTSKGYEVIGEFSCAGHNTNSFLRLFGGLNKGRPNAQDLGDAGEFARALKADLDGGKPHPEPPARSTRMRSKRSDRMRYGIRAIGICILVGASFVAPGTLRAQSLGGSGGVGLSVGDVSQVIGGVVALGFGLWHFAVPGLYRWQSYVPDAPESLVRAVDATNFFFSFSLSMIGLTNVVMPFITDAAEPISRFWLWTNVGLWTSRVVFQLVKPQGSHSPALRWGMTAAFMLTDALMIVSALDATF